MGDLIRLNKPKLEKEWQEMGASVLQALKDSAPLNSDGSRNCDDISIGLVRGVYDVFWFMSEHIEAHKVCEEMDWLLEMLQKNLPKIKKQVWESQKEKGEG